MGENGDGECLQCVEGSQQISIKSKNEERLMNTVAQLSVGEYVLQKVHYSRDLNMNSSICLDIDRIEAQKSILHM